MIVAHLHPRIFAPGDWIIRTGDVGDEMYFISSGAIEIQDSLGHHRTTLGPGDYLGEIVLLLDTTRTASARAKSYCDVFVLSKLDFGKVLKHFPDMLPVLQSLAEVRIGQDLLRSLLPREKYFSDCTPEFLHYLEAKFLLHKFQADEIILSAKERETEPRLLFVVSGTCQLVDQSGRMVTKLSGGAFFGQTDVFAHQILLPAEAQMLLNRSLPDCFVRASPYHDGDAGTVIFSLKASDVKNLLEDCAADRGRLERTLRRQLREQEEDGQSDSIFAAKVANKKMMESNFSNNKKVVRDEGLLRRRVSTMLLPIGGASQTPHPLSKEQKTLSDSMKRLSRMGSTSQQSTSSRDSGSSMCVTLLCLWVSFVGANSYFSQA